ncbi:MAG: hypothetical protein IKM34_07720 [Clostridia bacterium]|nr:hypothetical protein [Clostridia bacterium]
MRNENKTFVKVLAKAIRVITVPPLLIGALLVALYFYPSGVFTSLSSLILSITFLSVIPALSYLVWALIPSLRRKGRASQRKLAFVFSIIGYLGGVVYALVADISRGLTIILFTYFVSVVILTLINKLTIFRASGHGCGVTGPLLLPAYFVNPLWILPSLFGLLMVYLSSLALKRHTLKELVAGSSAALLSFLFCLVLF